MYQMVCTGSHYKNAPDTDDVLRKAVVFELTPIEEFNQIKEADEVESLTLAQESLESLRQEALGQSVEAVTSKERKSLWRRRSTAIRIYVLNEPVAIVKAVIAPLRSKDWMASLT
jgi:Mg/Co/Ni transporter MgtE